MKYLFYSLMPLAVLLAAAASACVVGYLLFLVAGNQFPLEKIIGKVAKFFLVMSIFPAMYILKLDKSDIGLAENTTMARQFVNGLGVGLITLMPVFIVLYVLGVNVIDETREWTLLWFLKKLSISFLLALLISIAEEPIFRGALLAGLKKKMPVFFAILISSAYYAALHFMNSKSEFSYADASFFSGFILVGEAFSNVFNPRIIPAFAALLMVGIFLGTLRTQLRQSLVLCIGCHTAWVCQIKMSKFVFNTDPRSDYLYLVSDYDGVIGPLITGWMMVVMGSYLGYQHLYKKRRVLGGR